MAGDEQLMSGERLPAISMPPIVMTGLFCADIQEETEGLHTLVNVFPDTVTLSTFPNVLGRLAFYLRVAVYTSLDPTTVRIVLRSPSLPDMPLTSLEAALVRQAQIEAMAEGLPFGTIVTTALASDFAVPAPTRVNAIGIVEGAEILCGTLRFERAS